ncbi:MAG: class I SAM-dependent methyltransferase, partial [Pacificimonas sp.]
MRLWRSPITGAALRPDGEHILVAPGERWPVLDGIPYLRVGRDDLVQRTLERLDAGNIDGALAFLLADADEWWDEPAPPESELRSVIADIDHISLREAMRRLGFGRVGDYFAHRWSDPTFAAGRHLLEEYWLQPKSAFELACGIGHYLRLFRDAGVPNLVGGDVVFAKLWLARTFVCPSADFVCFDAAAPWPLDAEFDLVLCADAFYFMPQKSYVAERLLETTARTLIVSHVHNSEVGNHSAGAAIDREGLAALFPSAEIFDDAEL